MIKLEHAGLAAVGTLLLVFSTAATGADDPPGVLWQMTSQMALPGMPMSMPPNTVKVCTAKEWNQAPPGGDKSCDTSNFQRVADKATWDVQCTGQRAMTGHGEITFTGTDSYTGAITAMTQGTNVKINLSGTKIGTCDKPVQ